jgi:hypothetical protein
LLIECLEARALLSFLPAINYFSGLFPESVAVGDFRHNGILDLAVANNGYVRMLLGNGDGTFQTDGYSDTSNGLISVAAGDFDGDDTLDLAAAHEFDPGVSVLLGNGDGTFRPAVDYGAGINPSSVAVGDFRHNGILDLAVANEFDPGVSVLLGNGDGTFQAPVHYAAGGSSVAVGDFDGDGTLDLAVANAASANVSVLLGNGDGTFRPAVNYAAGDSPGSVAVGDFNGDGVLDLAVSNGGYYDSSGVSILLGNGDGTFQAPVHYVAGIGPRGVAVGDFNGDGISDLAVANAGTSPDYTDGGVSVLLGNGDGTFQDPVSFTTGARLPVSVAVGDFNGDGWPDLAVANSASNNVSILLNDSNWPMSPRGAPGRGAGQGLPKDALASLSLLATSRTVAAPGQPHGMASSDGARPEPWGSPLLVDALFAAAPQEEPARAAVPLARRFASSAGRWQPLLNDLDLVEPTITMLAWEEM